MFLIQTLECFSLNPLIWSVQFIYLRIRRRSGKENIGYRAGSRQRRKRNFTARTSRGFVNLQTTMDVLVVNQSNCELPNDIVDITLIPDVQFISCLRIDYCVITLKNTDAIRTALCAGETVLKQKKN